MKTTSKNSLRALSRPEQSGTQDTAASAQRQSLPRISIKERRKNRALPTARVVNLLREQAPKFFEICEVVGKWVWVSFSEKQPRDVTAALSELGFHWNNIRQAWQHPCGTIAERTPRDPREKYGSYFPARSNPA